MKDYEVTIKSNSVSVKTKEFKEMIDPDTNDYVRVPLSAHRKAIGLGDFKGDAQKYKRAVEEMLEEPYGKKFSDLIAVRASLEQELDFQKELLKAVVDRNTVLIRDLEAERVSRLELKHNLSTMTDELEVDRKIRQETQEELIKLATAYETLKLKNAALEKELTIMENLQR
jgi:hypothetical protein